MHPILASVVVASLHYINTMVECMVLTLQSGSVRAVLYAGGKLTLLATIILSFHPRISSFVGPPGFSSIYEYIIAFLIDSLICTFD